MQNNINKSRKDKKEMKRYFNGQLTKLVDQVTSQELSIKLKELGVSAASLYFREWTGAKDDEIESWKDNESWYGIDNVNCYTSAELGEMLPDYFETHKVEELWFTGYIKKGKMLLRMHGTIEDTEANARAKMLIYLIENKLI